ncbi:MAG: hypothetical protein LBU34_15845, partial [Planctomycetaceae bacterium]|nr:hypothetical protein [Planctomycetaceae bacterium]
ITVGGAKRNRRITPSKKHKPRTGRDYQPTQNQHNHNLVPVGLWGVGRRFSGGCASLHRRLCISRPLRDFEENICRPLDYRIFRVFLFLGRKLIGRRP